MTSQNSRQFAQEHIYIYIYISIYIYIYNRHSHTRNARRQRLGAPVRAGIAPSLPSPSCVGRAERLPSYYAGVGTRCCALCIRRCLGTGETVAFVS